MPFQEPARVQLEFAIFLKRKEMKFVVTSPRPFLFFSNQMDSFSPEGVGL